MTRGDRELLQKIVNAWCELSEQMRVHCIQKHDVLHDRFIQWAITTPLFNIGEQTYKLSKELQEQYPEVPWKKVSGLRHRLVHNYEGTNWEIIIGVLYESMPKYIHEIKKILEV